MRVVPADIRQFETSDILALRAESIRGAGTCPVVSAVVGEIESCLRSCHYVIAVVRIDPHFANSLVLWKLTRRLRKCCAENVRCQHRPRSATINRFQDSLATLRERAVVQISRSGIDRIVVGRIDRKRIDPGSANQRTVQEGRPVCRAAAAIRRLPNAAAVSADIGNNRTVGRRCWINHNGIDSSFGRSVIKATGASSHVFGLRPERRETNGIQTKRVIGPAHAHRVGTKWNSAGDERVLHSSTAHPRRIVFPSGVAQTTHPFGFETIQVVRVASWHRHIALHVRPRENRYQPSKRPNFVANLDGTPVKLAMANRTPARHKLKARRARGLKKPEMEVRFSFILRVELTKCAAVRAAALLNADLGGY